MKRRLPIGWCIVAALLLFGLVSPAGAGAPISVKYATTVAPDHPNNLAALKFAEIVNRDSKGQVKVEVFPAAQLGNESSL